MDELEKAAYRFMNKPNDGRERLAQIKEQDIVDAIKAIAGKGETYRSQVNLKEIILDVNWLIEQAEKLQRIKQLLEYGSTTDVNYQKLVEILKDK